MLSGFCVTDSSVIASVKGTVEKDTLEQLIRLVSVSYILRPAEQEILVRLVDELEKNQVSRDDVQLALYHVDQKVRKDIESLGLLFQDVLQMHELPYTKTLTRLPWSELESCRREIESYRKLREKHEVSFERDVGQLAVPELFQYLRERVELLQMRKAEISIPVSWNYWKDKLVPVYAAWHKRYREIMGRLQKGQQQFYPLTPTVLEERKFVERFLPLQVLFRKLSDPASSEF